MSNTSDAGLNRREFLDLAAATIAAAMVEISLPAITVAQGSAIKSDPRYAFADCVADLVIPTTDTPGASAAGATVFVLFALDHRLGDLDPAMLTTVQDALNTAAGGDFLSQPTGRQTELLSGLDATAYAKNPVAKGSPEASWRGVKAAIVAAYYSSEIGATKELTYAPTPGAFHNITLTPDFRNPSIDGFGEGL